MNPIIDELLAAMPQPATAADMAAIEITAALLAEFRKDPSAMNPARLAQMRHFLAALGMTPSSRGKIETPKPQTEDAKIWEQLL
jgi:hypothetical protein